MPDKIMTTSELIAEIEQLKETLQDRHKRCLDAEEQWRIHSNRSEKAESEIAGLKDELHRLTIENARLEGYQNRVREFDPVTEAKLYQDRQHDRRDQVEHYRGDGMAAWGGRPGRDAPAPWYRRA